MQDTSFSDQNFQSLNREQKEIISLNINQQKILKQGDQIMLINQQGKHLIDLSDNITIESIKELGFSVQEIAQIRNYQYFKSIINNEDLAKIKFKLYKQKYICISFIFNFQFIIINFILENIQEIIKQIQVNQRKSQVQSQIFYQSQDNFYNKKQKIIKEIKDLKRNPNFSNTLSYFNKANKINQIIPAEKLLVKTENEHEINNHFNYQIHLFNKQKSQKQREAKYVIEQQTYKVQLLDKIKEKQEKCILNHEKLIANKSKQTKSSKVQSQAKQEYIKRVVNDYFELKEQQLEKMKKRLEKGKQLQQKQLEQKQEEINKFQLEEYKKQKRSKSNRHFQNQMIDKLRENILQELEIDINQARSIKSKNCKQLSEKIKSQSYSDLQHFYQKREQVLQDFEQEQQQIQIRQIEKEEKKLVFEQKKQIDLRRKSQTNWRKYDEYNDKLLQKESKIQAEKEDHFRQSFSIIDDYRSKVEKKLDSKSSFSQAIWKLKQENIKTHMKRKEKIEQYKFDMFKLKEQEIKLRMGRYNMVKNIIKITKEKKKEKTAKEIQRITNKLEEVTHIIDGKKLDYYEIDDKMKLKGSQLMKSFLSEKDAQNSLFVIKVKQEDKQE